MTPDYWQQASDELARVDPVMADFVVRFGGASLASHGEPFVTLARSIVGQQISVKAADSVWARLSSALPVLNPAAVLGCDAETLRACGLSARKVEYLGDLATRFASGEIQVGRWGTMSDAESIAELTAVRGIGVWTAEMFLMFTLLRPNVFPVDDIGLLRGLEKAYHIDQRLTPKQARVLYFERFSPWASVATWYLWRSLDPVEVAY